MSLLAKFGFWLPSESVLLCIGDHWGSGLANVILVRCNPVVEAMIFTEPFTSWMIDRNDASRAAGSILVSLKLPAYGVHLATFLLAGFLADYAMRFIRSRQGKSAFTP